MFKSYKEAMDWVAEGQAKYGKRAFTARPEYHAAYAEIAELHKKETPAYKRPNRKTARRIGNNVNLLAHSLNNTQTA